MRKYFLSFVALAAGLFATSCQESIVEPQVVGPTTFTVQLPNQMGTKAIGDAENIDKLYVAVYNEADLGATAIFKTKEDVVNGVAKVTLNLIQDQSYDIVFWAQKGESYVDENSELLSIPMKNTFHNSEEGAAFFHFEDEFTPGDPSDITLRRPFAQLNLGTTSESLNTTLGAVTLSKSTIHVSSVATSFNTVTGVGEATATTAGTYTADVTFDQELEVAGKKYVYVSMDYLPIVGDAQALVNITATIETSKGTIEHTFTSVPVRENYRTNIVGNLISSSTDFNVVVDERFVDENGDNVSDDNNILVVENAAAAQAALDNAKPGDVIELVAGVNYGTLLIRPVEGKENTITDCDYLVYSNEMRRDVKDLTIIGAPGAKVDAIKTVAGYISGSTGYVVNIENLVINSVEFTDKHTNAPHSYASPIFFDLSYINVNGLTVKNCKLIGNNDKMNFVYFYGSGKPDNSTFETAAKNVIIENNTVDGIARLCELRQTENVIITGNTIKNTSLHGMLLTVDEGTYSGDVTITYNTADGIHNRFVRMAGAGNAEVVIKDNYIYNYQGADADYIKVTDGSNVTIENNVLMVTSAVDLQSRVNSAAKGLNEFGFANDITGNVTIPQNDKINIVINGLGKKYDGTITVDGNSRSGGSETLVIKNINFEHSGSNLYFVEQNIAPNYPHNVTVEDCTFKGDGTSVIGGIRYRQGFNNVVKNCTAEGLYLFIWTTGGNNITIDNVDGIGYIEGGFSLGQCNEFTVKNSKIVASEPSGYGIRLSASMPSTATIENCEISSFIPVMVREASKDQTLIFNGTNIMTESNTDDIWCAIGTSAYNTNGTMPTPATGKVTVVLNDIGLNQAGVYGDYRPVAKIGETVYTSLEEAVKASTSIDEIILTDDAELVYTITNPYAPAKTINASVIDLNGKTMTIKDTDLRFNNTTIKNGKIVVAPGSYGGTAIFFQFNDLAFNDVEITATGLAGTYLIGLEGNSNLNLYESQIIIDNENLVNLTAAVACNGSGSTIVENSNIYIKNINGRAFLNTSCSVVNSVVTADYVKAGFRIPAGKTLSIDATSIVNITNLVGGNVNGIDLHGNATYNVEDGATINATVGGN